MEKKALQKQNILKEAYGLFRSKGYGDTTTRDIAACAGINKGMLHYYYRQKDDLIIEMYRALNQGLATYLKTWGCRDGWTYFAAFKILFIRLNTSRPPLDELLAEMILNPKLTQVLIDQGVAATIDLVETVPGAITAYQLRLAMTAAVGAESQLFLSMRQGQLKMTHDKLSTTITKLFFTMLKISEEEILAINEQALRIAGEISIDDVYAQIVKNNPWMES